MSGGASRLTSDRYILHITLTTGHSRRSPRSEVGPGITEVLRPLLDRALTGEHVAIPGQPGYTMTGGVHGRCCAVTVWGTGVSGGSARPDRNPVVTIGIAPHSRCGARLWRSLHEYPISTGATDPEKCPPEPWCAVVLHPAVLADTAAMEWLGDFERCIAWTWVSRKADSK